MAQKTYSSKELFDWMTEKARSASSLRNKLIRNDDMSKNKTTVGKMFFFKYDPKTKEDLPIYDVYPLVFPLEQYGNGFLGINIHYLTPKQRISLLGKLQEYATSSKFTPSTKLSISYDLLNSARGVNSLMAPGIKRYLFSQVRSKFIEIPATEWDKAAQLSLELFVRKG